MPFGPVMGPTTYTLPLPENLKAPAGTNVPLDIRVVAFEEATVTPEEGMKAPVPGGPEEGMKAPIPTEAAAPRVTAIQVRTN